MSRPPERPWEKGYLAWLSEENERKGKEKDGGGGGGSPKGNVSAAAAGCGSGFMGDARRSGNQRFGDFIGDKDKEKRKEKEEGKGKEIAYDEMAEMEYYDIEVLGEKDVYLVAFAGDISIPVKQRVVAILAIAKSLSELSRDFFVGLIKIALEQIDEVILGRIRDFEHGRANLGEVLALLTGGMLMVTISADKPAQQDLNRRIEEITEVLNRPNLRLLERYQLVCEAVANDRIGAIISFFVGTDSITAEMIWNYFLSKYYKI